MRSFKVFVNGRLVAFKADTVEEAQEKLLLMKVEEGRQKAEGRRQKRNERT
jgi:hypothetical protein